MCIPPPELIETDSLPDSTLHVMAHPEIVSCVALILGLFRQKQSSFSSTIDVIKSWWYQTNINAYRSEITIESNQIHYLISGAMAQW
jgi:hypothetical protein